MKSYLSKNITTLATTTVCLTSCVLHAIVVNELAGGYIEFLDGSTPLGRLKASVAEGTYEYDIVIDDSLKIVTDTAIGDITITYSLIGA